MQPAHRPLAPLSSQLRRQAWVAATKWLDGPEFGELLAPLPDSSHALRAAEVFCEDRIPLIESWEDLGRWFVRDYLDAGTASGPTFHTHPVTRIIVSSAADMDGRSSTEVDPSVKVLRGAAEEVYGVMVALAARHSLLCQEVVRREFGANALVLRRGVKQARTSRVVESWAFRGSVGSYGPIALIARVPVTAIVSIRGAENELIASRQPWAAEGSTRFHVEESSPSSRQALLDLPPIENWQPEDMLAETING